MTNILISSTPVLAFVLVDSSGLEVTGLGSAFTVQISKNGGAFVDGAGSKAEIGSGWYTYTPLTTETNTVGPLALRAYGAGTGQQNLLYQVMGAIFEPGEGTYILSTAEAANILRCAEDDPNMLMLLPAIDGYIEQATGRDWAADAIVRTEAKSAARMLLVRWHEDPGGMAAGSALGFGLAAVLTQLEAIALHFYTFAGRDGAGGIFLAAAKIGDTVKTVTGRVGATGDQSAKFETVITVEGYIQQTSGDDLSDNWYTAELVPPEVL